jgi:hypothetical protein
MVTSSKIKFLIFLGFNLMLLILLYNISISSEMLDNICLIKHFTGKNCWNCGMTRAFLSILHFNFYSAYQFNHNVLVVFPLTIGIYLYSWYKYILK